MEGAARVKVSEQPSKKPKPSAMSSEEEFESMSGSMDSDDGSDGMDELSGFSDEDLLPNKGAAFRPFFAFFSPFLSFLLFFARGLRVRLTRRQRPSLRTRC